MNYHFKEYRETLQEISKSAGNDFLEMGLNDKLKTVRTMKKLKKETDSIINLYYPTLCLFSSIDEKDLILNEKNIDIEKLRKLGRI